MEGFDTLYKEWLIEISQKGYNETHQYAIKYDLNLLVSIMEAKEKITEELRVAHLLFTVLALVCSIAEVSGHNHPHLGRSYVILIFISNWLVHIKF